MADPSKPLHMSASLGDLASTNFYLALDPRSAEEVDSCSRTAFYFAAAEGHKDIIKVLLEKNEDACLKANEDGRTSFHLAAMRRPVEVMKELLEKNKDACLKADEGGRTPLHLVAMRGQVEVMKELIN
ncbi:hypothetical protein Pint_29039 [Pistacia integerrima]|uniref:Uncharacterized protein n=1 Tax=Pistacia integerrima TaxID=434235 RepID=A0ACC0X1W7_9ROSI|nr:hypothetical protein Pint_29039 [Pistacia integerrima]